MGFALQGQSARHWDPSWRALTQPITTSIEVSGLCKEYCQYSLSENTVLTSSEYCKHQLYGNLIMSHSGQRAGILLASYQHSLPLQYTKGWTGFHSRKINRYKILNPSLSEIQGSFGRDSSRNDIRDEKCWV